MPVSQILGPDGQAIPRPALHRELAAPRLTGVRPVTWPGLGAVAPSRLLGLLTAADQGDADAYLTLAEEMEERDPHYASVLNTRKRAVLGLQRVVESASDDPPMVAIADAVRELVQGPEWGGLLSGLLDALGKGYSVVELLWETEKTPWMPRWVWRDPRYFHYDRETAQTLRLRDEADLLHGLPLAPYRFVVHTPRLKMGLPVRGGLARLVALPVLCGKLILNHWFRFTETYGMPVRVGRYEASATEAEKATLQAALRDLGADAYAVLADGVKLEFLSAPTGTGGTDLYARFAQHLQELVSKAVLGRSDAADATPGKLGTAQDSIRVRQDLLESDAEELQNTVNAQLIRPFVDLNFGPQPAYPRLVLAVPDQEDLAGLVDMLAKLVPLGLKVEQSVIRDQFGLPDPDPNSEMLAVATPPSATTELTVNRALNRERAVPEIDPTAPLTERLGREAEPLLEGLLEPVRKALEDSADLMDFRERLLTLYPDLNAKAFAELMGQALAVADAQGQWEAHP